MTIFREFSGRQSYLTREETDRLNNPEKYGYDQARYDQFVERIQRAAERRQATSESAKDAILTSYAGRGSGGTNPGFSFSSFGGQTSGGTAGLSGFAGTAGGPLTYTIKSRPEGVYTLDEPYGDTTGHLDGGTSNYGEDYGAGTGSYGGGDEGPSTTQVQDETTWEEWERDVQNMEAGGLVGGSQISSPYASPMTNNLAGIKAMQAPGGGPRPPMTTGLRTGDEGMRSHGGIGGLFRDQFSQMGQQMNQMQSEPLNVYRNYLTQTYVGPSVSEVAQGASQEMTGKVDHFLDLVDQAERAHFEVEESFGFGGGPMAQPSMSLRGGMAQPAYMGQPMRQPSVPQPAIRDPYGDSFRTNLTNQTDAYSAQKQLSAMQMMPSMG